MELKQLTTGTPDLEAAAVVDNDGFLITSALPDNLNEEELAAMSASLRGMSERSARELSNGRLSLVMIPGSEGTTILPPATRRQFSRCSPPPRPSSVSSSTISSELPQPSGAC